MSKTPLIIIITALLLGGCAHKPQNFAHQMQRLEKKAHSTIGISAIHIESGHIIEYKPDERFKMASTVKLPIGIFLLHEVEQRKISLEKMVRIEPYDLVPGSGLIGYYLTRPGLAMSIYNLLESMMAISDNSSTDIILSKIGGPSAVEHFMREKGITDISIDRSIMQQFLDCKGVKNLPPKSEQSLQKWKMIFDGLDKKVQAESYLRHFADSKDTTTPRAMTALILKLHNGELLNSENTKLMFEIMGRAGNPRIKQLLPKDAVVMHKTGSWNQEQIDAFYNYTHDVGIIALPQVAGHIAISIYTGSHMGSTMKKQTDAIAKVAKLVYNSMMTKKTLND